MDLVKSPWLAVSVAGHQSTMSVEEVLLRAHEIDGLADPVITVRVAELRQVLLPIVLDALGVPTSVEDWAEWWRAGRFESAPIKGYLDRHRHRFQLFDGEAPFAQVAGLASPNGDVKSSSLLVPSLAAGNSVPLFSTRTEAEPPDLSPTDALRWLLHTQCWDTAGIKTGAVGDDRLLGGKVYGNPTGPLGSLGVVVPTGRNLFETLLLNIKVIPDGLDPDDAPQWRRAPAGPAWFERSPAGVLDLMTWQARRIRLIPTESGSGVVVRSVVITAGDRLLGSLQPDLEWHTLWRYTKAKKGQPRELHPRRHRPGRAAWQGLDALRALDVDTGDGETSALLRQVGELEGQGVLDSTYPLGVELVGVEYGTQSAVVEDVLEDRLPLPVVALRANTQVGEFVDEIAGRGGELVKAVDSLEGDVSRARGGELTPWDKGQRASTRLVHRLDRLARRGLEVLQSQPGDVEALQEEWFEKAFQIAREIGDEMLENLPASAHAGRESAGARGGGTAKTWNVATAELRFLSRLRKLHRMDDSHDEEVAG